MTESKSGDISLISRAKTRPQNKFNISCYLENVMKIQISVNAQFSPERNVSKIKKSVNMCEILRRFQRRLLSNDDDHEDYNDRAHRKYIFQEIQHGLSFLMVREDFWNNVK